MPDRVALLVIGAAIVYASVKAITSIVVLFAGLGLWSTDSIDYASRLGDLVGLARTAAEEQHPLFTIDFDREASLPVEGSKEHDMLTAFFKEWKAIETTGADDR